MKEGLLTLYNAGLSWSCSHSKRLAHQLEWNQSEYIDPVAYVVTHACVFKGETHSSCLQLAVVAPDTAKLNTPSFHYSTVSLGECLCVKT